MPQRVQRKQGPGQGWPDAPGDVYVGEPSKWGNPHRMKPKAADEAVRRYREDLLAGQLEVTLDDVRRELRGKDLACWCPPEQPCHGDVLLELANE